MKDSIPKSSPDNSFQLTSQISVEMGTPHLLHCPYRKTVLPLQVMRGRFHSEVAEP